MTAKASPLAAVRRLRREGPRFRQDGEGHGAVEFALLLPAELLLLATIVLGGVGFEINRKVEMTMDTLTDLASRQKNVGTSSTTYTYSQILAAASKVIAPYDTSLVQMVLSEVQTNGTTTGKVVWSKANANGTPLTANSNVTVPSGLANSGYLILGTVSYTYNPLNIFVTISSGVTLSNSIYVAPRASSSIACCN